MTDGRILSVLMIDDSTRDILYYKDLLERAAGHRFMITDTARLRDGIMLLKRGHYDLVLLDLNLLDSSAQQTVESIPRMHRVSETPVVVLSHESGHDLALKAVMNGASDYLVKERDDAALASRIITHAVEYHTREAFA